MKVGMFRGFSITTQRYNISIAVYECFCKYFTRCCSVGVADSAGARHSSNKFGSALAVAVLQCCSSREAFQYPKNTSIFIYKYRVNFWLSYNLFWNCNSATLQQRCARRRVYFPRKCVFLRKIYMNFNLIICFWGLCAIFSEIFRNFARFLSFSLYKGSLGNWKKIGLRIGNRTQFHILLWIAFNEHPMLSHQPFQWLIIGCKVTNKWAKYQIYLSIFERE